MDIALYQVIVFVLTIITQFLIVRRFMLGKFNIPELVVSSVVLLLLFIATMFPDSFSNRLAALLGIKSNINAVLFGGILLSLWLNFRLWMLLRVQDKKMAKIIRLISLKKYRLDSEESNKKDDSTL